MELGPTEGCQAAIACLTMHCDLLRGSTSKEVLEVFYQEVGIRLQAYVMRNANRISAREANKQNPATAFETTDYLARGRVPDHRRFERIPFLHRVVATANSHGRFRQP